MPKKKTGHYNTCPICKNNFWVTISRELDGRGKYCSKNCMYKRDMSNLSKGKEFPERQREGAPNFQGGRIFRQGYVWILDRNHPRRQSNNYVPEHWLVMEQYIGRYIQKGEVVHHVDGNKTNNDIENLELMTRNEHDRLHAPTKRFWEKSPFWQKGNPC